VQTIFLALLSFITEDSDKIRTDIILSIINAIEDAPVIVKILTICAYRPAPRPGRRRVESICSRQSEVQVPLANASRWRRSL
jgi:hypothetical protein